MLRWLRPNTAGNPAYLFFTSTPFRYGAASAIDPISGKPLFTEEALRVMDSIIKSAESDELSDPFGVQLHFNTAKPGAALPIWRCVRGTNMVESYHRPAHHHLNGTNNQEEHASVSMAHMNIRFVFDCV